MIQVIIVDDEILSRIGVQSFIDGKNDISVAAVFESAEDAITFLEKNPVDVVITDIEMDAMSGLEFIKEIREKQLAGGVIILSCHDDFHYAQEAISNGTDAYLLKHSITEESLLSEIDKVYKKIRKDQSYMKRVKKAIPEDTEFDQNSLYRLVVFRVESSAEGNMVDSTMLVNLLENLVAHADNSTLFSPYDKEMFILMHFDKTCREEEIKGKIVELLTYIDDNMEQYISSRMIYSVSGSFSELSEMRRMYHCAQSALQMTFYSGSQKIFFTDEYFENEEIPAVQFDRSSFLNENGLQKFEEELNSYFCKACFYKMDVQILKNQMIQSLISMKTEIIRDMHLSEMLAEKHRVDSAVISMINHANTDTEMTRGILKLMENFRNDILWEFERDELSEILVYIDEHLSEKIGLNELAEQSGMSVATFIKKFKERTGVTLVQYLNEKRIEKARQLLKNKNYSLWMIAEKTGFSNTNYMVRVFKKITGQTVSDYRRKYGTEEQ